MPCYARVSATASPAPGVGCRTAEALPAYVLRLARPSHSQSQPVDSCPLPLLSRCVVSSPTPQRLINKNSSLCSNDGRTDGRTATANAGKDERERPRIKSWGRRRRERGALAGRRRCCRFYATRRATRYMPAPRCMPFSEANGRGRARAVVWALAGRTPLLLSPKKTGEPCSMAEAAVAAAHAHLGWLVLAEGTNGRTWP